MKPLTWALKEVDPIGLHKQSLRIVEIFKIAPHKQKFWKEDGPPPPGQRGPVHNSKSGTDVTLGHESYICCILLKL